MKFDTILEYQKIDAELLAIERELRHSPQWKAMEELRTQIGEAGKAVKKLDAEAEELRITAERAARLLDDYEREASEIREAIDGIEDVNGLEYCERRLAELCENAEKAHRELSRIAGRMDSVSGSNSALISQAIVAQKKLAEAAGGFEELKRKLQNKAKPVMEELKELMKDIPKEQMSMYRKLRARGVPHPFAEYGGDGSCFCGLSLPNDCKGRLKEDGDFVECPTCGRVIVVNGPKKDG